jgi:hypothetical protein
MLFRFLLADAVQVKGNGSGQSEASQGIPKGILALL